MDKEKPRKRRRKRGNEKIEIERKALEDGD